MVDTGAEEVRRWIESYINESLKEQYLKYLEEYCQFHGKTPIELLKIKRSQKEEAIAEMMLDDFVILWKEPITYEGRADEIPDSVRVMAVRAVRSFYSANYADLAKKAGKKAVYVRKKDPVAPDQGELRELCVGLNLMNIALINVLSSGGFREGTLIRLNWGHILPKREEQDVVHIRVTAKDLKGKGRGKYKDLEQHAFLTPHAVKALLDYRKWRESRGEIITPESPLFSVVRGEPKRISAREFRAIFERACERHPFKFSPHDLRRFTQTQLETARVQPNWIRKMLGKKIKGEEEPYSRPQITKLMEAFRGAIPHLTLAPPKALSSIEMQKQSLLIFYEANFGRDSEIYKDTAIKLRDVHTKSGFDNFMKKVKPFEPEYEYDSVEGQAALIKRLNEGWEHHKDTENGTIIIKMKKK